MDTLGWVDGEGYNLLFKYVNEFKINIIVVCGHDRLHAQLSQDDRLTETKVVKGKHTHTHTHTHTHV